MLKFFLKQQLICVPVIEAQASPYRHLIKAKAGALDLQIAALLRPDREGA